MSRVIIITGASAGVGRASAERFAVNGDRIGLIARDAAALEDTSHGLLQLGAEAVAFEPADVADPDAVFRAAERLERALGPVDVWVNDAMETVFARIADISPGEVRRVTEVCYLGCVHGTMAALKSMRARGKGQIVQIGSALAYRGIPLQSAYCAAKHAIRGFTASLRTELIAEGSRIGVAIVELPAVNTPQFDWARIKIPFAPRPVGRPIKPEVAAEAVFRAAKGHDRELWLGVPTFLTILGNSLAPWLLDHFLARTALTGQMSSERAAPDRADNLETPITDLHRTSGRFVGEAEDWAPVVSGDVARAGAAAAFALICFAGGALYARRRG
ncbi:NAD(P)-dependent dehydrogenase (short-subunit alcohol dehydrogenase family) [Rhodoblastus acidophilus]|uniref:SDR family oxidoreductase n=1 Tax=Rhodoblastus acidophilus TaxID=1074 RepID=UPI00222541F6|nr:SDR family oxidoreductase [Rhodoblastus acidophilus]MCW2283919.1 NAD(P)-dependent dehydrogenase (short-subunit alcohol dehydrogenase family) [Rhodoblastus acidophilus]MCW2332615.1 NAD(P)-dependent dehydrogenase (short-subunit alcohol dehydrogenase family) [Rhodoblastus acidophilus]